MTAEQLFTSRCTRPILESTMSTSRTPGERCTTPEPLLEFQVQCAVSAEMLEYGRANPDLQRISQCLQDGLSTANQVWRVLQARGWQLLPVRLEEDLTITFLKYSTAERVALDLLELPEQVMTQMGRLLHVCVTAGHHVFELSFADGRLGPIHPADICIAHASAIDGAGPLT